MEKENLDSDYLGDVEASRKKLAAVKRLSHILIYNKGGMSAPEVPSEL